MSAKSSSKSFVNGARKLRLTRKERNNKKPRHMAGLFIILKFIAGPPQTSGKPTVFPFLPPRKTPVSRPLPSLGRQLVHFVHCGPAQTRTGNLAFGVRCFTIETTGPKTNFICSGNHPSVTDDLAQPWHPITIREIFPR